MKIFKSKIFIISFMSLLLLSISGFILVSCLLPKSVTVTPEELNGKWLPKNLEPFLSVKQHELAEVLENSSKSVNNNNTIQSYKTKVYLCSIVPIKTVEVSVVKNVTVTPGGECIGINLKTRGILVVGIAEFENKKGKTISPGKEAGFNPGDSITKINGQEVTKALDLAEIVNKSEGELTLGGTADGKEFERKLTPQTDKKDNAKKIGLWVRESIAGIGTVTFYKDGCFASLGHSISDIDTGNSVNAGGGTVCKADVVGIDKGKNGSPGSLLGVFSGDETGKICTNTDCGVYGTTTNVPNTPKVEIALKNKVRPGKATIRCDIGTGCVKDFDIEITRIVSSGNTPKNMIIKVTDKELLKKTGGIVQGMSGSPILQNGKLVGAVTHVFVNDPTRGYGIFIENMLQESEKIK